MTTQSSVKANFNYTRDTGATPEVYFYEPPAGTPIRDPGDDPHVMQVRDGWSRAKEFSLDREGFELRDFTSGFESWEDDAAIKAGFYTDVINFVKATVGARRVVVFDHTIRAQKNENQQTNEATTTQRAPVMLVHCDYTSNSAPTRVRQLLPDEAEELLKGRVAFFNFWKPLRRPVEERPLAMCDVQSSKDADFITMALRYRERNGEIFVMRHSPEHNWWYFPKMTPEHVVLLKTYDSATDGRARFVGHSAFVDPTSPPNAPFRESIEIRTVAFF